MILQTYLSDCAARPFRPGRHDCATFAHGWVRKKTSRDLTGGYRHTSITAGKAWLLDRGFADHVAFVAAHLPEIPVALARVGDIAAVDDALGIVGGEFVYILRREGLGRVPLTTASRAFRVESA